MGYKLTKLVITSYWAQWRILIGINKLLWPIDMEAQYTKYMYFGTASQMTYPLRKCKYLVMFGMSEL